MSLEREFYDHINLRSDLSEQGLTFDPEPYICIPMEMFIPESLAHRVEAAARALGLDVGVVIGELIRDMTYSFYYLDESTMEKIYEENPNNLSASQTLSRSSDVDEEEDSELQSAVLSYCLIDPSDQERKFS